MRRFDKKLNMVKANLLAEQRYMESKGIDDNPVDSRRQQYGDYEAGQQDYEDMEALKNDINSEKEGLDEATTSWKKLMVAARQGVAPFALVVIDRTKNYPKGKVIKQEINIDNKDMIPAHYESLRKEFPNALIHLEDSEGMSLWSN
jgi:hypothetical protein